MANRRRSADELKLADHLLSGVREMLRQLCNDDEALHWALRRKICKELDYDERGKPMHRRWLKKRKREQQGGRCSICGEPSPADHVVLDRFEAMGGYTQENTRLIHQDGETSVQRLHACK